VQGKPTTKLSTLFSTFSAATGVAVGAYRFSHDGTPLDEDDTIDGVGLSDDAVIEAFLPLTGGS